MSLDLTKPYQTRDGRRAWVAIPPEPIKARWRDVFCDLIGGIDVGDRWDAYGWSADGKCVVTQFSADDIVNVPEKHTVKIWINVYDQSDDSNGYGAFRDRSRADSRALPPRIACIEREITYEVGEGLEP